MSLNGAYFLRLDWLGLSDASPYIERPAAGTYAGPEIGEAGYGSGSYGVLTYAGNLVPTTAVTPGTLALVLTTFAPTVTAPAAVTPGPAALTLTTFAPTVTAPATVTPDTAALALTSYAPTVTAPATVTPSTLALLLTGYAPTVTAANDGGSIDHLVRWRRRGRR